MLTFLRYLFYKYYKFFRKINSQDSSPEWTASLAVGTLIFFNILSIGAIINVYLPFWTWPEISRSVFFLIVGLPWIIILYFLFIYKKKYLKIIEVYKNENENERRNGRKLVLIYIITSIFLVIGSWILIILHNSKII